MFTCHDDQGGGPKMAKISGGVKPDIFKRAAQKWPKISGGVKIQDFGPPLRPKKKVLLTAEKMGSAQNCRKNRVG